MCGCAGEDGSMGTSHMMLASVVTPTHRDTPSGVRVRMGLWERACIYFYVLQSAGQGRVSYARARAGDSFGVC